MELDHLMSILEFVKDFFEAQESGLASVHPVFLEKDAVKSKNENM